MPSDFAGLPRRPSVLLVDDQPVHLQVLHQALGGDCQTLAATGGRHALDVVREHRPDLILLDIDMPAMDGFATLKALRADPATRDIPVVFVTGHNDPDTEAYCLNSGGVDFVSKPIHPTVLRARVYNQLRLKFFADMWREWVFVDGLTGAFNRRYFDEHLVVAFDRARRDSGPLSVVMVDVDAFKAYNDHFGHQAGDDVLRRVVPALRAGLRRPGDVVTRYGGEEFACLLPDTDAEAAAHVGGLLRQAVEDLALPHVPGGVFPVVTISVGVSTWRPGDLGTALALVERADQGLYQAKRAGRNRVVAV
jgi:diguanylate cyclase (GGDEF)-like protein